MSAESDPPSLSAMLSSTVGAMATVATVVVIGLVAGGIHTEPRYHNHSRNPTVPYTVESWRPVNVGDLSGWTDHDTYVAFDPVKTSELGDMTYTVGTNPAGTFLPGQEWHRAVITFEDSTTSGTCEIVFQGVRILYTGTYNSHHTETTDWYLVPSDTYMLVFNATHQHSTLANAKKCEVRALDIQGLKTLSL